MTNMHADADLLMATTDDTSSKYDSSNHISVKHLTLLSISIPPTAMSFAFSLNCRHETRPWTHFPSPQTVRNARAQRRYWRNLPMFMSHTHFWHLPRFCSTSLTILPPKSHPIGGYKNIGDPTATSAVYFISIRALKIGRSVASFSLPDLLSAKGWI